MVSILVWVLIAILAVVCIAVMVMVVLSNRKLAELEHRFSEEIQQQKNELSAILDGTLGVGKQVQALSRDCKDLRERQQQLAQSDLGALPYNQAMRLVAGGADADQLVDSCGLSRSEAELLILLHKKSPPVIEPLADSDAEQALDENAEQQDQGEEEEALIEEGMPDDPEDLVLPTEPVPEQPESVLSSEHLPDQNPDEHQIQNNNDNISDARSSISEGQAEGDDESHQSVTEDSTEQESHNEPEPQPSSIERAGEDGQS